MCASVVRAAVTGSYIKTNYDDVKIQIKPNEFSRFVDEHDKYYAFLQERLTGQDYVELTYEELTADADKALSPVYGMLGVPPRSSKDNHRIKKQSTLGLQDTVVNFEELKSTFATTERAGDFW